MSSTIDIAWAAGFIEGEGSFGYKGRSPIVRVAQVNPEPLYKLKRVMGGHINFLKRKNPKPNHRDYYYWQIGGSPAAAVMMTLYDLFSNVRQIKVRECLIAWKKGHSQKGARGSKFCSEGHEYTKENTYIRPDTGMRSCRICRNKYGKIYMRKRRALPCLAKLK